MNIQNFIKKYEKHMYTFYVYVYMILETIEFMYARDYTYMNLLENVLLHAELTYVVSMHE